MMPWELSELCEPGAGTPEVMTLVYKAVQRGYAVVAVGAHRGGDKWRCYETHWPPEEYHEISGVGSSNLFTRPFGLH